MQIKLKKIVIIAAYLALVSCGGEPQKPDQQDKAPVSPPDVSKVPNAVPRDEPRSKYGNPSSYEVFGKRYYTMDSSSGYQEQGIASWYGTKFHGRRTSSGEPYDMYAMTAAHKTLPLPTYVEVTNLDNGRTVIVKVNDRGPFHQDRLIDLSYSAATQLNIVAKGTGRVALRAITPNEDATEDGVVNAPAATLENTTIYLQIGAFRTISSAEKLQTSLQQSIDDEVIITQQQAEAGMVYRVRVGPVVSADYADSLASRLDGLGFNNTYIVVE